METTNRVLPTDYGITDYLRYYNKGRKDKITRLQYNKIISDFNSQIVLMIINEGLEFKIPKVSTTICVRKTKRIPKFVDGKFVNTIPVDWKATKELWASDEDAKEKKILLRFLNNHTSKHIFRIKMLKYGAIYKNKKVYKFKPARSFQRDLAKRIKDPNQDSFQAYNLF